MLKASLRRAARLRIDTPDVLPEEQAVLVAAEPAVNEPRLQALLAWRRSVLLVIAAALVPLALLRIYQVFSAGHAPGTLRALQAIPMLVEIGVCALAFLQASRWADWRRQREILAVGAAAYLLAPLVVYLYPLHSFVEQAPVPPDKLDAAFAGVRETMSLAVGVGFSLDAILHVAPRAAAVVPALLRAAVTVKLLAPRAAALGWLVALGAPVSALVVYLALVGPYQLTGRGSFAIAIIALVAAHVWIARAGYQLTRPQTHEEVLAVLARVRTPVAVALGVGAAFLAIALYGLGGLQATLFLGSLLVSLLLFSLVLVDGILVGYQRALARTGADDVAAELAPYSSGV